MDPDQAIIALSANGRVFHSLLRDKQSEKYRWKPAENKWCLLEIVCHLFDEEREDFRARVKNTLENPGTSPPAIDPVGWVAQRKYLEQHYEERLTEFLRERDKSIKWLNSLQKPSWQNHYDHASLGRLTAAYFLDNWLAHDFLHIRQINRMQYQFLQASQEMIFPMRERGEANCRLSHEQASKN